MVAAVVVVVAATARMSAKRRKTAPEPGVAVLPSDAPIVALIDARTDAERALLWREYARFIALHHSSAGARPRETLSPPPRVDAVWHHHLLHTRHYAAFCRLHAGRFVHHDAARASEPGEQTERRARYERARELYARAYGAPGAEWPPAETLFGAVLSVADDDGDDALRAFIDARAANKEARYMVVYVKEQTGNTRALRVLASDTVLAVKRLMQNETRVPPSHVRLLFAGKNLEDERTLSDYNILRDSTLHQVYRLRGC